ncbi:ribose import ATP-binding protein RbsA [Paenibacillus marchantiophytorum]|uniref:Ribose import ATP-binding protein RbsA n=1 Tax=Paenibacillus marchantiophytorum TaxID=1619310 RepID=A0ABQ1EMN1_9BACL|nr:sugar ABC transporter ATP-binding protein [Paenibacillus marchantiophytorum]GFZ78763.1 ribose import ATP-binding protein RbsA [Paenibacillus marchantiophytorum]
MEKTVEPQVVLLGSHLTKQFYGNIVLEDLSISCKRGTVLALVGENGAGKSTLMNIISGGIQPDSGSITFMGNSVTFKNSQSAKKMGIAFVHQELSLLPDLSVGENMMLGQEPVRYGFIHHRKLHEQAESVLKEIQYDVDVYRMVKELTPAEKQMVEIAKAWIDRPSLLILDEPTSSLSKIETDHLFKMIRTLKSEGTSIILITHRMDEIFRICDEVVVLKDGRMTKTEKIENLTRDDLIQAMVGREIIHTFPPRKGMSIQLDSLLKLKSIGDEGRLNEIDLEVPRGRIIGVGGLEGQGQRQLARGLFGLHFFTHGELILEGKRISLKCPVDAMKKGIAFISDDRKSEGLILPLSVLENMSLLNFDAISRYGIISRKTERREINQGITRLAVKTASPQLPVQFLSGGNQQKVIFAKWLAMHPRLLILHEPTRGVDVQSKLEIYRLLRELADGGVGILVFTSDMLELIGISDRIYVMYEGRIMGQLDGEEATEEKIMTLSSGKLLTDIQKGGDVLAARINS